MKMLIIDAFFSIERGKIIAHNDGLSLSFATSNVVRCILWCCKLIYFTQQNNLFYSIK